MKRTPAVLACLLAFAGGCSGERDPGDLLGPQGAGTIVVDARLITLDRFPPLYLTVTQSPDRPFDRQASGVVGADVLLTTADGDTIWYADYEDGMYMPVGSNPDTPNEVRPRTTYRLRAVTAEGRVVTAETTTPDTFRVREWLLVDRSTFGVRQRLSAPPPIYPDFYVPDSVYRADSNQLLYQDGLVEARFDRGNAVAFQMALFNIEINSPLLIDADFLDEEDKLSLERESSSPPLDAPDGYVRLPWLAVWYEGRHRFVVYSVDRNWYDLARSLRFYGPSGLGFGSNAGDYFERPIFHVQGGIGLFGSASMDQTGFTVWPGP